MNLDDLSAMQALDAGDVLGGIDRLPEQLARAWALGQELPLPQITGITRVVIGGMGTAAIAAELLAGYAAAECRVPVLTQRDYGLPAYASGKETLFIACSPSGDNEETLDGFEEALKRGCSLLVISGGGKLADRASAAGCIVWRFSQDGPPGAALGYCFGLLLAAFARLGLLPAQDEQMHAAVVAMQTQQKELRAEVPAALNPAKRYAGQMVGRWVTIFGSGVLGAVARRWKSQINELARAPANVEILPEASHNALVGVLNPAEELLMPHTLTLFLRAAGEHPRNSLGATLARQAFMLEGLNTDFYQAQGEGRLAQLWTAIHFGDYLAFYLAVAYAGG